MVAAEAPTPVQPDSRRRYPNTLRNRLADRLFPQLLSPQLAEHLQRRHQRRVELKQELRETAELVAMGDASNTVLADDIQTLEHTLAQPDTRVRVAQIVARHPDYFSTGERPHRLLEDDLQVAAFNLHMMAKNSEALLASAHCATVDSNTGIVVTEFPLRSRTNKNQKLVLEQGLFFSEYVPDPQDKDSHIYNAPPTEYGTLYASQLTLAQIRDMFGPVYMAILMRHSAGVVCVEPKNEKVQYHLRRIHRLSNTHQGDHINGIPKVDETIDINATGLTQRERAPVIVPIWSNGSTTYLRTPRYVRERLSGRADPDAHLPPIGVKEFELPDARGAIVRIPNHGRVTEAQLCHSYPVLLQMKKQHKLRPFNEVGYSEIDYITYIQLHGNTIPDSHVNSRWNLLLRNTQRDLLGVM